MTEELDKDEQHFIETGEASEALVEKHKAETPPPAPVEAPPAAQAPNPEADDDSDDDGPVQEPVQGQQPQTEKQRRRFSRKEFESERQARLTAEKQYNDQRVEAAKVAERLALLQQALQTPAEPEPQGPQRPDPEQDIFGYTRWLEEQLNGVTSEIKDYKQQIISGQQEMDNERRYFEDLNTFAGQRQDFIHAYNYLLRSRAAELTARSYQVTEEQLQGIMDGRVRVPQPVADALKSEERDLYRGAFQAGQSPAARIYQYATMRGYRAPAAQPAGAQPAAPAAGTPGTPLGGTPAAPQPRAQQGPTATDVVNSIQKGQSASASLSKTGGTAPDTELTPQALANMSDADFERLYHELSMSGNKEKLKQIFGH